VHVVSHTTFPISLRTHREASSPPVYRQISSNHNGPTVPHLNALQGILLVSPHLVRHKSAANVPDAPSFFL